MASIIRSPDISEEKRKLTSRRGRVASARAVAEAFAPPQAAPSIAAAPVARPASPPPVKPAVIPDPPVLFEQARQAVLKQFKSEGEQARELGLQRGLQEGRIKGNEESVKSADAEITRLRMLVASLSQVLETQIAAVEDVTVAIAFEAICKVLGQNAVTRDGIVAVVRQAATHAIHTEKIMARINPDDLKLLRTTGVLDDTLPSGMPISWVSDETVLVGGCVLETDSGELDARLETQIEQLRATITAARSRF
jgi:flagellar assembly protein FliH